MAEVGILARNFGLAINSGEKALIRFQFFLQYYQLSTTHKYVSHMSGCARSIACHPCPALHVTLKVERALIRSQFYFAKLQTISDAYGRHMKRCTRAIACDSCTGLHVLCKMNTEAFRASCWSKQLHFTVFIIAATKMHGQDKRKKINICIRNYLTEAFLSEFHWLILTCKNKSKSSFSSSMLKFVFWCLEDNLTLDRTLK